MDAYPNSADMHKLCELPRFIMKRIKLFILLALLCSTFFLKGCDQNDFTFSFGFVLPYFDITADVNGTFDFSCTYNILLSVIINLIFVAACTILIFKIDLVRRRKVLSKIYISLLINIIIFDISILYSYTKIIEGVFSYYIFWPIMYISDFLPRLKIELQDWNVVSRVYLLIVTGIICLVISLFGKLRGGWLRIKQAKRLRHKMPPSN